MGFWHLGRTRRRPYGRRSSSHPWVEDREYWAKWSSPYWWLDPSRRVAGLRTKAIPMPHGGVRYVFRCPLCSQWRLHLYNIAPCVFFCRRCLGLRYKSQYIGRRLASRERSEEARLILERAEAEIRQKKVADRRARRAASARLRRQQATWRARRTRFERDQDDYEERRSRLLHQELARIAALIERSA